MGTFAAGQVVIVHIPFSDLTASKVPPAVVLSEAGHGDWILCQITSKSYGDTRAIHHRRTEEDEAQGGQRTAQILLQRHRRTHRRLVQRRGILHLQPQSPKPHNELAIQPQS